MLNLCFRVIFLNSIFSDINVKKENGFLIPCIISSRSIFLILNLKAHKFKHNFLDSAYTNCSYGNGIELDVDRHLCKFHN